MVGLYMYVYYMYVYMYMYMSVYVYICMYCSPRVNFVCCIKADSNLSTVYILKCLLSAIWVVFGWWENRGEEKKRQMEERKMKFMSVYIGVLILEEVQKFMLIKVSPVEFWDLIVDDLMEFWLLIIKGKNVILKKI